MKKNTQKLLVFLYAADMSGMTITIDVVLSLFSQLSEAGTRSLIHILKKKQLLAIRKVGVQAQLYITDRAKRLLKSRFPAFDDRWLAWKGEMDGMVFLQPPQTDPQFRYLRKLLLDERAYSLTRGVYLAPLEFSEKVRQEVQQSYQDCIVLFQIGHWKISVESAEIISAYGIQDVVESYSGISKEIDRLLHIKKLKKALKESDKRSIFLVYDRIYEVLLEDAGFCAYYFPHCPRAIVLLQKTLVLLLD